MKYRAKGHPFKDVVKDLVLGRRVRRQTWDKDSYIVFINDCDYPGLYREGGTFLYDFKKDDMAANDWEVL